MRNHACLDEALAVLVEIYAPGIARAFGKIFERVLDGMITPDAAGDDGAVLVGRTGLADLGKIEHAVAAVKPTVRTPGEGVQRFVRVVVIPAVEQNLRRTCGFGFIAVLHRDEHEIGRRADPHTAKTD